MELAGPSHTVLLTERRASQCRLTPADVAFFLAHHRRHLQITPTGQPDWYRLAPAGHVGTLVGPNSRLVIRPKIPLANLFLLLDPAGMMLTGEDFTAPAPGLEAFDFLAGRLAQLLAERAAAGLHRDYVEQAYQGPFLQGRLDLPLQLREAPGTRNRFHCRPQEFTVDVPCNQVGKATAELVVGSPYLAETVAAALNQSLRAFSEVSSITLEPGIIDKAALNRLTDSYQPLLALCRLLLEGLNPGEGSGAISCPAFLLDMERIFERYCTLKCPEAFSRAERSGQFTVSAQPLFSVSQPKAGQPELHLRPDLTVNRDGRPILILDAKWKRLGNSPLVTGDVYQMLAYCTALGVQQAILVYPGRRDRAWSYTLTRTPITVTIRTLRVVGSREACSRSVQRLLRTVRQALRESG